MSAQYLVLVGSLGKDPEMRYTPSGTAVTTFSMATGRTYNDGEKKVKETCWFRVTVWGKKAEACNDFLRKGSKVTVSGRLVPDTDTGGPKIWEDKGGKPHANFEVNASEVTFESSGGGAKQQDSDVPGDF
jgi:single-strand DNA-binding protein